jgi:hypothetical protein
VAAVWPQVPITLLIAVVVSWVSLLGRYRHRGQPFGTSAARRRAVAVIMATAIAATGVAYLVTSLTPASIGMSLVVLIPPLLCVQRLQGSGPLEDTLAAPHFWLDVATVGVASILDKLELQMAVDRDNWCDLQLGKLNLDNRRAPKRSLAELETAGKFLYSRLGGRGDPGQPPPKRLQTAYEALQCALDGGETGAGIQGLRKRAITAEKALTDMLQFAYDWGHTDNGILPNANGQGMPPPAAGVAGAARSRSR